MKVSRVFMTAVVLLAAALVALVGAAPSSAAVLMDLRGFAAATAPDGRVWLVWAAGDGLDSELSYSQWNGRDWSSPRVVHANPDAWDSNPSLAFAADGTAWLAWTVSNREMSGIYASHWAGTGWSRPEVVPAGKWTDVDEPTLAAAPDGTLWLAWVGFDGEDDGIVASHWDGGAWSSPQQVSADEDDASLYDRQPRLVVGEGGEAWLVWTGHQVGVDDEIYASRWTGSTWTPEQMVNHDDDALDTRPSLALDAKGQPWVAWKGRGADGEDARSRILVSHWDASRQAWTAEAVASSPLEYAADEELPTLSTDGRGDMQLAWMVASKGNTALAHAGSKDGQWAEPRLVGEGVEAGFGVWLTASGEVPRLLWLDASLVTPVPARWATVDDRADPLSVWLEKQAVPETMITVDPISNRFLAFGDSITEGNYPLDNPIQDPFTPYPATLEATLSVRVMVADVINAGQASERVESGMDRIKEEVSYYLPQYVIILEGTNDVSRNRTPGDVLGDLLIMLDNAKKHAGVDHIKVQMGTLIPRLDGKNGRTQEMNEEAIAVAADQKNVPLCDPWQAFINYGNYAEMYWNDLHPNQAGLNFLADTFYHCLLTFYPWLTEDTNPPTTWVDPLPDQSECGVVNVSWGGIDNLSWVVDYDVQINVNSGGWVDWLLGTQDTSATYSSDDFGDVIAFRARGRDVIGNESDWSLPEDTQITDSVPPYEAHVTPLPPAQIAPFSVSWGGQDACADVVAYNVQYSPGGVDWTDWLIGTASTSGSFDPTSPLYGQTYYFRAQAQDEAGNWSAWSDPLQAYTLLAQFSLAGDVYNARHQPVAFAQVAVTPNPLWLSPQPGGFLAYLDTGGDYDLSVSRNDLYGPLPTMFDVAVDKDVSGLQFILPPQDDAVADGGFETGSLDAWQVGGSTAPTLTAVAHTGLQAARLDGTEGDSHLTQVLTPGLSLTQPTLSFLVRLDTPGLGSSLQVELANTDTLSVPMTYTLAVADVQWTHVWYDLTGMVSQPLTLTLAVSGSSAVLLDEVSLGSALKGSHWTYLPVIQRQG
jgi:lysophospholipase L1-like esterase